jgi:5-bromo-4-chloroindolyl phosphate hydrolysis protein
MNFLIALLIFFFISIPASLTTWLISFFGLDMGLLPASGISIAAGIIAYLVVNGIVKAKTFKRYNISHKEYIYIRKNLKEAKPKLQRLRKAFFQVRDIASFKQQLDTLRVANKIYSITKKEPKRFYQAEPFYYSHLDSMVELAEKYAFLSTQPKKNSELLISLSDTKIALRELSQVIEEDLNQVLSNDIDKLNFELDVVKKITLKSKNIDPNEESRRIK